MTGARREPGLDRPPLAVAADLPIPADGGRREPGAPSAVLPDPGSTPPAHRDGRGSRAFGPAGSLALHLAALVLMLIAWHRPPPLDFRPIPIKLVFAPPRPPAPKPKPEPKPSAPAKTPPRAKRQVLPKAPAKPKPVAEAAPPHGRLSSADIGDTNPRDLGSHNREGPEAKSSAALEGTKAEKPKPEQPTPAPPKVEKPKPPKKTILAGLPPPLDLTPRHRRKEDVPWPLPLSRPHRKGRPPRHREARRETTHIARYPGTGTTRSAYLAYLVTLTRRHLDLLPSSLIAGRHGETVLNIQVLDDGTIAMVSVAKSSGYPDIDRRVEDIIAAVGRFPPIPQWFQGDRVDLKFRLRFPFSEP